MSLVLLWTPLRDNTPNVCYSIIIPFSYRITNHGSSVNRLISEVVQRQFETVHRKIVSVMSSSVSCVEGTV